MTASTLAALIEAHAEALAKCLRVYAALNPHERDELVASLSLTVDRCVDDWATFMRLHNAEQVSK